MTSARRVAILAILSALLLPALPSGAATSTSTSCFGGASDGTAIRLQMTVGPLSTGSEFYLSRADGTFWREDNGAPGLQRTAKVCYEQTYDASGKITSSRSYVAVPADDPIVP